MICEEMGRAASANSYLGGAVLAVSTLNALQPSDTRDRLLADVASGAVRLAVAAESSDFVPDAEGADRVLLIDRRRGVAETRRDRDTAAGARRDASTGDGVGAGRCGQCDAVRRRRH